MKKVIAVLALSLAGCASTANRVREIPAGPEPSRAEAERIVKQTLASTLKDPESLKQFQMGVVMQTRYYTGLLGGNTWEGGWRVCFQYNAKNSYGGYVGLKQTGLVVRCTAPDACRFLAHGGGFESASC